MFLIRIVEVLQDILGQLGERAFVSLVLIEILTEEQIPDIFV